MNAVTTGIAAGAAGTTMLDAVTYLDMAIRGRPASTVPEKTVESVATALGVAIPGRGDALAARRSAFGALGGIAVGTGLGVAAALVRRAGAHLTPAAGTIGIGLAAMAATDIPIAVRGISDPRQWTAQDWLSDLVPHLVYGATVTTVLRQQDEATGHRREPGERSSTIRSAVIGVASGLRSSTGIAAALLSGAPGTAHRARLVGATALVGGELVADKNPNVPSRLSQPALTGRLIAGGGGAAALARRDRADTASALIIGTVGALAGSHGGAWWRQWASRRMPDWQAALAEDAVALTMAATALRRPARSSSVSASR
ncbi:hypothetical protein [Rhodococcus opacus]|uniref:hypothetical protein n=1 Tax=Rhodococcus opacus TaxID=37919 RepID=UPI002952CD30|nr:hypothetical protein [Rhodococcus opacus]MDV7090296.1 hypothetical protein [Rhodococcus opacus]